ncbi:hypothetical protein CLAIMM_09081 isoform 3 [Cladophialophora immunda]|nr:hypothetical protein CLAIMM_09081 isoform 1 [Cladophialophora immunda]OQV04153.1 hypothetical protein CLAIMM_09081 isoform 2 [Cladophialophora immunda]OQV04154.1 hypothetical protein CLAIMM_09081 isoform 3 [Cladophialophora immunda]
MLELHGHRPQAKQQLETTRQSGPTVTTLARWALIFPPSYRRPPASSTRLPISNLAATSTYADLSVHHGLCHGQTKELEMAGSRWDGRVLNTTGRQRMEFWVCDTIPSVTALFKDTRFLGFCFFFSLSFQTTPEPVRLERPPLAGFVLGQNHNV